MSQDADQYSCSDALLSQTCDRGRSVALCQSPAVDAPTGKDCQRYGFRAQPSAYMAAKALAPVLAKQLGKNIKAAYLVPDYTYGHSVYDSMKQFTEQAGWKTVNEQLVPLGTTDFSSYLLNIGNSGADAFINVAFGADAVSSTKQADQFGILSKMKYVVPNISQFQAKELGAKVMGGTYGTQAWWWTEEDKFPLAKLFVAEFEKKNNYKPRWGASEVYVQMLVWADAVVRAGSFNPADVIKALESGTKVDFDLWRGLLPRRGSSIGAPGAGHGRQEARADEGPGGLLRRSRTGPRRTGVAAARRDRLQNAGHRILSIAAAMLQRGTAPVTRGRSTVKAHRCQVAILNSSG